MEQLLASNLPTYPEDDSVILEYVALRKKPFDYVCKSLVVKEEPKCVEDCRINLVSLFTTATDCPDFILKPVMMCRDPFRKGRCKLVLCDVVRQDQETSSKLSRDQCKEDMESKFKDEEVWLGFEQEYYIVDHKGMPYEWDMYCQDAASGTNSGLFRGQHVGEQRHLADTHLRACLYAGLAMYGCQRESNISRWEYQVGPAAALDCVDQLLISRFILMRLCEMMKVCVNFDNPVCAEQAGVGRAFHVNFSTKNMREPGGIKHIHAALDNMATVPHEKLLKYYDSVDGADAKARLRGKDFSPYVDKFFVSVGNKALCSIRIPAHVERAGKGYFEERRVGTDVDPYDVARILTTAALSPADVE